MKVDPECLIAISSLSEEECIKIPLPTPSADVTMPATHGSDGEQRSISSTTTVGVAVVVVLFIITITALLLGIYIACQKPPPLKVLSQEWNQIVCMN